MEAVQIARKFTTRAMGMDNEALKEIVRLGKGEIPLFNVLALVSAAKVEPNRIDPTKTSTRFYGQFEVTNLMTAETGTFPEAYFPGVAESFLAGQKAGQEGAVVVPFILTVSKDDTKNSAQGYKFGMKAFVNKEGDADPFKAVRGLLPAPDAKKALAAPAAGGKKK